MTAPTDGPPSWKPLPPIDLPVLYAARGGVADHTHTNDGGWCAPTDFIGLPARSSTMTDATTNHEPPFGTAEHAELVAGHRHPGIRDGLQWLTYTHLPPALRSFSEPFYRAAVRILWEVGADSSELTTAINRLVEAKDSAVRAGIRHTTGRAGSVPRPQAVTDPPKLHTPEEKP